MRKIISLSLFFPLLCSPLYAKNEVIPKILVDSPSSSTLKKNNKQKFKKNINAKGTILSPINSNKEPLNWFNLSPLVDNVEGVSTEETYKSFGQPQTEDVIVAVIDSGVDVNHADLQGKIWINQNEIPENRIDDDNNGYIDDVFGWNFIGGKNGNALILKDQSLANGFKLFKGDPAAQVSVDTYEVTREYIRAQAVSNPSPEERKYFEKVKKYFESKVSPAKECIHDLTLALEGLKVLKSAGLKTENYFGSEYVTLEAVKTFNSANQNVIKAKANIFNASKKWVEVFQDDLLYVANLDSTISYYTQELSTYYNTELNTRSIVGDDYSNIKERTYGNNDVIGPDASHGTHVAGIIAADRENGIGIKGVASNVKIMAIRAVPDGDERDKDVANAIRYAVDNGAKIINMSFGKSFSPGKQEVDLAVQYAESKGVLLVHAAGNSNQDNDNSDNFPNRHDTENKREFSNWLEIGASSFKKGISLPAVFSNYGKNTVDFFAPGVNVRSSVPDDQYDSFSGTSMAAPVVSGVAALVLSYKPELYAKSLRDVLQKSSRTELSSVDVNLPGTQNIVKFGELSKYGSIVDSFNALKFLSE